MVNPTHRRRVLGVLAAVGSAALSSSVSRRMSTEALPLQTALLNVLSSPEDARAIGAEYLRMFPSEASIRQLVSLIRESPSPAPDAMVTTEAARALLQQAVRDDFQHDRTVTLHGWVVSRTEARLCALACLS